MAGQRQRRNFDAGKPHFAPVREHKASAVEDMCHGAARNYGAAASARLRGPLLSGGCENPHHERKTGRCHRGQNPHRPP